MQPRIKVIDSDRKTNGSNKSKTLFYKKNRPDKLLSVAFWYTTAFKELFRVQFISKRLNIFSDNKTLTF